MAKELSVNRLTPVSGLGAVLFAHFGARFGNAGGGVPSPFEAGGAEIAGYYSAHSTFTAVSSYLYALSVVCLVVFAAGLWHRLSTAGAPDARPWAMVGLTGTAVYSVLVLLLALIQLSLVGLSERDGSSPEMVAGLAVVWAFSAALLVPGSVPLLLGFGMAGRRGGLISGLLTTFAFVGVALGLLPPPEVAGPSSPPLAGLLFVLSELQPWFMVFWLLGVSFVIHRSERRPKGHPEPAPASGDAAG